MADSLATVVSYEPVTRMYAPSVLHGPRFEVWATQPDTPCHVLVGEHECATPTPFVLVYSPATLAPHAPTKRLPICPECAHDMFGIDVLREALHA